MERVILNKVESIERCVKRIEEIYGDDRNSLNDFLCQDALILNIQRACQQSIDLAMYICSKMALGIPKKSGDSFNFLKDAKIITGPTASLMKKMVGFRNIAIHEYQNLETEVIRYIAERGKNDFLVYANEIIKFIKNHRDSC